MPVEEEDEVEVVGCEVVRSFDAMFSCSWARFNA